MPLFIQKCFKIKGTVAAITVFDGHETYVKNIVDTPNFVTFAGQSGLYGMIIKYVLTAQKETQFTKRFKYNFDGLS